MEQRKKNPAYFSLHVASSHVRAAASALRPSPPLLPSLPPAPLSRFGSRQVNPLPKSKQKPAAIALVEFLSDRRRRRRFPSIFCVDDVASKRRSFASTAQPFSLKLNGVRERRENVKTFNFCHLQSFYFIFRCQKWNSVLKKLDNYNLCSFVRYIFNFCESVLKFCCRVSTRQPSPDFSWKNFEWKTLWNEKTRDHKQSLNDDTNFLTGT